MKRGQAGWNRMEKTTLPEPGLNLNSLAKWYRHHAPLLSGVINEGYGMNFNDCQLPYRIEEFKRLAQREKIPNHALLYIVAFIVGSIPIGIQTAPSKTGGLGNPKRIPEKLVS